MLSSVTQVAIASTVKPLPNPPLIKGGNSTAPLTQTNRPEKFQHSIRKRFFQSFCISFQTKAKLPSLIREGLGMGLTVIAGRGIDMRGDGI